MPPTGGCRSIKCGTARQAEAHRSAALFFGEDILGIVADFLAHERYLDQRQDVVCGAARRSNQHTVTALTARPVAGGGQRADSRRTEVGDRAEIDRQRCYAGTAFDGDLAVQGRRGVRIDIAADDDAPGRFSRADRSRRIPSRLPVDALSG